MLSSRRRRLRRQSSDYLWFRKRRLSYACEKNAVRTKVVTMVLIIRIHLRPKKWDSTQRNCVPSMNWKNVREVVFKVSLTSFGADFIAGKKNVHAGPKCRCCICLVLRRMNWTTKKLQNCVKMVYRSSWRCEHAIHTRSSLKKFHKAKIFLLRWKASNAGGVATSGLEMKPKTSMRYNCDRQEEVDEKYTKHHRKTFTNNVCKNTDVMTKDIVDYVKGANYCSFVKLPMLWLLKEQYLKKQKHILRLKKSPISELWVGDFYCINYLKRNKIKKNMYAEKYNNT